MNKEYEYSFKVKSISDFIKYCNDNGYTLIEDYRQERSLYKNNSGVMARITNNGENEVLSFKEDNLSDDVLKVRKESKDLVIDDNNREFVLSLLDILDMVKDRTLIRDRKTFVKDGVKFEIDEYITPVMRVVAVEGIKKEVDIVYKELEDLINKNEIN